MPVEVSSLTRPPQAGCAEFKINLQSCPYLADHGFQNVHVLPGSLCLQMALLAHEQIFQNAAAVLKDVTFQSPVIISDKDTIVQVKACCVGSTRVEYTFFERASGNSAGEDAPRCFAKLEVVAGGSTKIKRAPGKSSIEQFKDRAESILGGEELYRMLRDNGNQYGPSFQVVSKVWRARDRALARVSTQNGESPLERSLYPAALDSVVHLLAALAVENGRTFALTSIHSLEIYEANLPENFWVCAARSDATKDRLAGDIVVFDDSGQIHLALRRVSITYLDTYLDRHEGKGAKASKPLPLCVASTFTAEPLGESLKFWANFFGVSIDLRFASHAQIFQPLLDRESAFHKNNNGFNVILLALEDWIRQRTSGNNGQLRLRPDRQKLDQSFNGSSRYLLPNGLEIVHFNQHETDYLYQEIFRDRCYLQHGIELKDGATVIDVGANIGLFSLFVMNQCRNPKIYAFEPSPVIYELLKRNCEAYGTNVRTFQCGVSRASQEADFTFYGNSSVFSSFQPDQKEDKKAIEAIVRNTLRSEIAATSDITSRYVTELTAERLRSQSFRCRLVSLSEVIREQRIEKIELLKIDAERSELEILNNIDDCHWPLIEQIVIEVHDSTRQTLAQIKELLHDKGYNCTITQNQLLEESGLFNIYATRASSNENAQGTLDSKCVSRGALERNISEFRTALESFMSHSERPLLLCVCPRTGERRHLEALDSAERDLLSRVSKIRRVHAVSSTFVRDRFPLTDYFDPDSHALAAIPYTAEGYAAIGTVVFHKLVNLERFAPKVIVFDCDDTLWEGACGEDGSHGIRITDAHRALQQFAVDLAGTGVLVCLCSKNNEKDVFEVFDQRQDMVLKREHLAAWQISWSSKSAGIKALTEQLNLSPESFVFIDNDPVECAEVRAACPETLILQLPANRASFRSFLNGIWDLGIGPLTREDRNRTGMYREELSRQTFRTQTLSLKEFLDGLQLHIDIRSASPDQFTRVAQLTLRTNQFNFTTIRRSEEEIKIWLASGNRGCLVAHVSDRFGDYGLVGALLYELTADECLVDTFLLSCRALGRGVEHRMLAALARQANQEGRRLIRLTYVPTERNEPALIFIKGLGVAAIKHDSGHLTVTLSADTLVEFSYQPALQSEERSLHKSEISGGVNGRGSRWFDQINWSEAFQKISDELSDIKQITKAIKSFNGDPDCDHYKVEPTDTLQTAVMKLWKKVLKKDDIGLNDNFFDVGGTSLKAVQVIALIQKELGKSLSVTSLFECPTITLLSAKLDEGSGNVTAWTGARAAQMRGQQRRLPMHGISRK